MTLERRSRLSADQKTIALSLLLVLGAAIVLWRLPFGHALVSLDAPIPVVAIVIGGLFLLGEQVMVNVEFRRQAYSLTLAGIPLALGLMLLPPHVLVVVRLIGSATAFAIQRIKPVKVLYNLAAYGFEAALVSTVAHWAIGAHPHLTVPVAAEFGGRPGRG